MMHGAHGPAVAAALRACEVAQEFFAASLTDAARDYLRGRGFTDDTIQVWGFGWAVGHGAMGRALKAAGVEAAAAFEAGLLQDDGRDFFFDRVMVPIRDPKGQIVAFAGRLLPATEAALKAEGRSVGKYVNSRESVIYTKGSTLFGLDRAKGPAGQAKQLVVVEGQMDVIAAHQAGHRDVVAACGTALTEDHLSAIARVIPGGVLLLALDGDDAGAKATAKAVRLCWTKGQTCRVAKIQGGKDVSALVQDGQAIAWNPRPDGLWLVDHLVGTPPADKPLRLERADSVLAVLQEHGDRQWLELHIDHLADRIDLPRRMLMDRLRAQSKAAKEAAMAPVGAAAGPGSAAVDLSQVTEVDRGFHRAVITRLTHFLDEEDMTPDAVSGWMRTQSGQRIGVKTRDLVERFLFRYASCFESLSKERVGWTLSALVQDRRKARRSEVLSAVTAAETVADGQVELVRWVKAVTGREDSVDIAVMAHFLWQVKRRAKGLEVDHDIMPIVVGGQGDGKSRAVKRLCAPLEELNLAVNATTLTDDRCKEALADYVVGIWDELQGGSKADVQALKNIITADIVAYRELGSHTYNVLPKTITLIATSNDPVADIIPDTGGARRYYELLSNSPRCDWETINDISYVLLWQAVSHLDPAPILPVLDVVKTRQKGLVHQDSISLWLAGETWERIDLVESDRRDLDDHQGGMASIVIPWYDPAAGEVCEYTYRRFARWCRLHGQAAIAPNKFGGRLKALKITRKRDEKRSRDGSRAWRYHLPNPCPEEWAIFDRLVSVSKTNAERSATNTAAAQAFGAVDLDSPGSTF